MTSYLTGEPLVDEGLGNSAWLVDLGDGRALAVDAPRDLRALRAAALRRGLTVAFAADTHLHADFLSGARQLAAEAGAVTLAPVDGERRFPHRGLADGDEVELGGLTMQALATPGHSDDHISLLLRDGATPVGVFTGGSLIVGSAARTDLLGSARTDELARKQYGSLRRLAQLPDETAVWPTHGAGSFCSAAGGADRSTTIGAEKAQNPLLTAPDVDTFVARLVAGLGSYPAYFGWLAELNRRGPDVLDGAPILPSLDAASVRRLLADGAMVVDVRPVPQVAAGYLPGSVAIPLRPQFATWLGWLVDPDVPVIVVRDPDQDPADILWPALNIGYERLVGELAGGPGAWREAGGELARVALREPGEAAGPAVLDVRQENEFRAGHLPGAVHIELGELPYRTTEVAPGPVVVMCAHGERSMTAATLLARSGHPAPVVVFGGGAEQWAAASDAHRLVR
ncbi:MBL fold metallo-hydrolase [Natronosporangium hydrolyticum]|uniref:MBL fold metallo-hydrolase n=1 Tax=Natronosporangium hydrolyticum TaxID=2811111 RepID=A0A895Y9R4_9ACTN|nr:MBL fold metallo-hydrolase [Natronosporangium hydrolyticum]QSB14504.1 MBL fold metallo-hydrolase [Natronosporangium hydrolyticum]